MYPHSRWIYTPLDFISRREWWCSIFWLHYTERLWWMGRSRWRRVTRRPIDRLPTVSWPQMPVNVEFLICVPIAAYGAIFVAGWNVDFPTSTERLLWRISSIAIFTYSCVGCILGYIGDETYFRKLDAKKIENQSRVCAECVTPNDPATKQRKLRTWLSRMVARARNNSPEDDPMQYIPLRFWFPATVLSAMYCLVRAYVLVEDIVSLRSLPASAYTMVDWTRYLPHL